MSHKKPHNIIRVELDRQIRSNKTRLHKAKPEVSLGKFLGFMVSQREIEANPEKVQGILEMTSPKIMKEVQKLIRRITALNRFISKAIDKCLPYFKTLN